MADILDQLQERETRAINQEIGQASHDFDWSRTFMSTPPTEKLREQRNLVDLVSRATDRKMAIMAQTNEKAQNIYIKSKKFENEQKLQPLKEELLLNRIDREEAAMRAQGASSRLRERLDKDTMDQVAGFSEHLIAAPDIRTPEYRTHVLQGIKKYPRAALTQWGKETLTKIAQESDVIETMFDQLPDDFDVSKITRTGDKTTVVAEPASAVGGPPDSALKELAKLRANRAKEQVYLDKETVPKKRELLEKNVAGMDAAISAWQETYQPKTDAEGARPAATAAPPNITSDEHAKLKSGDLFWWNGKQIPKK